jgi:RNA polymerase sigma factor for flagellar operon FliA
MAPVPENPEGITARRRATYYATIADTTSMKSRLELTNAHGHTSYSRGVPVGAA